MVSTASVRATTVILIVFVSRASHGGSIDYLTNQSADYIRTFSRNAANDGADAATFNPAGTGFLDNGLYLALNLQTVLKFYSIGYEGNNYEADDATPILPTFFSVFKWRHLAGFVAFTVPGGGGSLTYEEGVPYLIPLRLLVKGAVFGSLKSGYFEGSSMYLGPTLGAAYELWGRISLAVGGRLIYARRTYKGWATYIADEEEITAALDTTMTAVGMGGVFGVHFRPTTGLNIGIRYETKVPLEFTSSTTTDNLDLPSGTPLEAFADGARDQRDLPAVLGIGVSYDIWRLTLTASWTYYFIKQADNRADASGISPYAIGYDDDYDDGMDIGFSVEYRVNDSVLASIGYNHSLMGGNQDTYTDFEHALSSHSIGGGVRYRILDRLHVTAAVSTTVCEEGRNESLNTLLKLAGETFNKTAIVFALSAEYRLL